MYYIMNNYYKNRDEILIKRAEYYQKNKEMIKQRNKIYYKEYYEKNKPKMIARASEWLNNLKIQDYERYRTMLNESRKRCYDKKRKKPKVPKQNEILKVIEAKPILNLKFDDELSIDLTEY